MASKQMNIRLNEISQELLENLLVSGAGSNKTDIIQRGIYTYACTILGEKKVSEIVNKHYSGLPKEDE